MFDPEARIPVYEHPLEDVEAGSIFSLQFVISLYVEKIIDVSIGWRQETVDSTLAQSNICGTTTK